MLIAQRERVHATVRRRTLRLTCAGVAVWLAVGPGCSRPTAVSSSADEIDWRSATRRYEQHELEEVPRVEVVREWVLDRTTGGPDFEFDGVSAIDVDEFGNAYVLESGRGVTVVDARGRFVLRFGSRGRGPAELWNARSIAVSGDTVFILDESLKTFTTTGAYLGQITSQSLEFLRAHSIAYTARGLALFTYRFETKRPAQTLMSDTLEVRFLDVASESIGPVAHAHAEKSYRLSRGTYGPALMGTRRRMVAARDGRIFTTHDEFFSIEVRSRPGALEHVVADVARVGTTRDDFQDDIETAAKFRSTSNDGNSWRRSFESAPRAAYRPAIGALLVSRAGDVLLERPDLGSSPYDWIDTSARAVWLIIGRNWTPVASFLLKPGFLPRAFDGCTVTGIEYDEFNSPVPVRYSVALDSLAEAKLLGSCGNTVR